MGRRGRWERNSERGKAQGFRAYVGKTWWALRVTWDAGRWLLIGVIVGSILMSLIPALAAWVGRNLIDAVVNLIRDDAADLTHVVYWLVAGFLVAISQEFLTSFTNYLKSLQSDRLSLKLTLDILEHSAVLDYAYFEDPEFQDVAERARYNASDIFTTILYKIITLVTTVIETVSLSVVLIAVDPAIVLVMLLLSVPYGVYRWAYTRRVYNKEFSRTTKRRWTRYFVSMMTSRSSVKEIKLLDLSPLLIRQYRDLSEEFIREDRKLYTTNYIVTFLFTLLYVLAFYILFYRISLQAVARSLTVGDVSLFAAVTMRLRSNLDRFAQQLSSTSEQILYLDNLIKYFEVKPRVARDAGATIQQPRAEIDLQNVTFTYPGSDSPVLHDIDLHISPGETVALVGENGAGKSTLVSLIARLYRPDTGQIRFDGIDLQDLSLEFLHRQISFVLQSFNQYEASARDNIAYGNYKEIQTLEDVKRIAQATNVSDLIEDMPYTYDTLLGRRFGQYDLSLGMWQKIAIARALAREHASLLILDEPTASLDVRAEWELFKQFRTLARDRTAIIISHRFTTVSVADRIVMLEKGRIVEVGTHRELLDLNGKYATLFSYYQQRLKFSPGSEHGAEG